MIKMTKEQQYEVHGTVQLPVSFTVDARNKNEAQAIAQYLLNDLTIEKVYLNILTTVGKTVTLKVHDHEVTVETVFGEEE